MPIRVSLIEDDSGTRERVMASIAADGELLGVSAHATGEAGLAAIAGDAPDVLLVDLGLPDVSGLEVIRRAAALYPDLAIMVLTAFGDEANVLAALEAGAQGYLLKGNLTHEIGVDIRDLKSGGAPLSPLIARHLLGRLQAKRTARPPETATHADTVSLTPREREILNAISRGYNYSETATLLGIAPGTVHTHLKRIYRKLSVGSKTEAVFEAGRMGLL
jgi:DNA-binding NarL/FixJ family response regulator